MKKRALVSVFDKYKIVEFCKSLVELGYEIISTGGTYKTLKDSGIEVIAVDSITNFSECLDGRVKTLHPHIHAGILAMRENSEHMQQLKSLNINTIDIVCVNLYPFKQTVENPNVSFAEAVENIDIGGPTMLRSAAKNYQDVLAVVDPSDYGDIIGRIKSGELDIDFRKNLMYKVFAHTAFYDSLISNYLREKLDISYPNLYTIPLEKKQDMRYGENPHQTGSFYIQPLNHGGDIGSAEQLHGKELSYNNINDANGSLELLKEYDQPTVVAVKHANPCGVASADDIYTAYLRAYESDPVSIFGGIVAANGIVDERAAAEINKTFIEIVIAKGYTDGALDILQTKKNIRILKLDSINSRPPSQVYDMKKVFGGMLVQSADNSLFDKENIKVVTKKSPTDSEMRDLIFAFKAVKHTKSNAIVLAKNSTTIGIGAGQTNRIWACEQAIEHAGDKTSGAVMASDAFFPFPDCVQAAADAGITAIIQPGGSVKDQLSIELCDKMGIAMIFVGERHFKH